MHFRWLPGLFHPCYPVLDIVWRVFSIGEMPIWNVPKVLQAFYLRITDQCSYNSTMSVAHAGRRKRGLVSRLLAVLMLAVLTWAHPVEAVVLHYCSHAGLIVEPGHDCCKPRAPVACCTNYTNLPVGRLNLASAPCSECCEVFTVDQLDPEVALGASPAADLEYALRDFRSEAAACIKQSSFPAHFKLLHPPPRRTLYLLFCRLLR